MRLTSVLAVSAVLVGLLTLQACDRAPSYVEETREIDLFLYQQRFRSACVGLKMRDNDELREYTAQQLSGIIGEPHSAACLCAALYDPEAGTIDEAVVRGIAGSDREDLAECLAPAITDDRVQDRVLMARALGAIGARRGFELVADLVSDDPDPAVRYAAAKALKPSSRHVRFLIETLASSPEPAARAGAAEALDERVTEREEVEEAMYAAVSGDENPRVRAVAATALARASGAKVDRVLCERLLDDEDEQVRTAVATAFHGTRDSDRLECLERRLTTLEESAGVRRATLDALGASPAEEAAQILCRSIGPFLRLHVVDSIAEQTEGVDIIKIHNDRDWQQSYRCVQRALAQGGYSCYARNHLGRWFRELGGSAPTPWCPGMIKNTPGG